MGVPSFYRWLVNKYPKVVEDAVQNSNGLEFDNFYLDMNEIIHNCFHPDDHTIPTPKTFEDVFRNVFDYIDRLVDIIRPRKLLYMAIDGVAPRAKLNRQRVGRFRTAKNKQIREAEEERLRKQFETEGKLVLPKRESELSDPNVITPGTEFMHELSKALKSYITSKIISDSLWKDIMVILSDANVPGEGEHKIMSYIRKQRCLDEYNPNTRHCLYGCDADLIMLAMATHEPHFSILREVQDFPIQQQQQKISTPFKFLHVWLLREYLETDLKIEDPPKNFTFEFERIIDDFIFMCFFAGNDFLPCMPSLEVYEGAIDLLLSIYKKEFGKLGGYLLDMSKISEKNAAFIELSRVEKFILMVGAYEEKIFKKRSEIKERKLRRLINDYEDAKLDKMCAAAFHSDLDSENSDSAILSNKATASKKFSATFAEILQNTNDLKDEVNKCMREKHDLFKSGDFLSDKIKLGTPGYKERYYKAKFSVEGPSEIESKRKEVVQKYTEGLLWVLRCYFSGVASWSWFYPFHYGPFASDLKGMGQVRVNFEKGVPFLPFDQLLSMLPPASAHALPKAYAQLILDDHSRIIDFYPQEFEVDTEGKRFLGQGICKLPWIDEGRLLAETKGLSKTELSENEALRNAVKVDSLFVGSSNKLAEKINSILKTDPPCKPDTRISDDIGGIISLCHVCVEKRMEIYDNKKEDRVLCFDYELLDCSNHIPRLLSGVNLPEKTITEDDIMKTELWHESQKYNRFERVHSQNKWWSESTESRTSNFSHVRSFSSNIPPEVIHRGAGVGWAGRGKAISSSNMKSSDPMANDRMPYLPPFHKQHKHAGTCYVTNTRDTRSQDFVNSFRQIRISESNQLPRPGDTPHEGPHSQAMPFGRGHGRNQHSSRSVNSWTSGSSSTNISLQPQWRVAKSSQGKDKNPW